VRENEYGQVVGDPVAWSPRPPIEPVRLDGRWCTVVPYSPGHVDDLFAALCVDSPPSTWTYIAAGPFDDAESLAAWLDDLAADPGSVPHVICNPAGRPVGVASYLRLDHVNGSAEVGAIVLSAGLQRTTAATEAMFLMMRHVLGDLGYRRYEWKCDSANAPSRRAAARLGFTYEGTFRNALVYKGRNRDTDWFSITDAEWPAIRAEFERWLDPANFDADGNQASILAIRR
jgi:RimJ/RimL family protein N-acetyltransferase